MSDETTPQPDSRARAIEFWFDFDLAYNPGFGQVSQEVLRAYSVVRGPDFPRARWREHRLRGTYPEGFVRDMTPMKDALLFLADGQLAIIDRHFGGDADAERSAFEDFGQGVLFDDRRPPGEKIHKMDVGGPDNPPIGYHRWHAFNRAIVVVGGDAERWRTVDRNVGLAWAIQSEARPEEDRPDNPGLPPERLAALRAQWTAMTADELDAAFDHDPFPAGVDASTAKELAASGFDVRHEVPPL